MKRQIILFSFLLFISWTVDNSSQSEEANAKIKSIYIYNFTKYIEWPDAYKQGNFVIGVVGTNNSLMRELGKMASLKMVGNQKIEVINTSANELAKCNIVYVLSENAAQLAEIINNSKNTNTLIIADKAGAALKGAGINFVVVDNKQTIEINKANIEKYRLKISTTLMELAIQVK